MKVVTDQSIVKKGRGISWQSDWRSLAYVIIVKITRLKKQLNHSQDLTFTK